MARIITYTFLMTGLLMIMYLSGLQTSGFSMMLSSFGITMTASGVSVNALASGIAVALSIFSAAGIVAAVVVGFFTRQSTESALIAPFAALLSTLIIADLSGIVYYFFASTPFAIGCIVSLLFVPMITTYIIAVVQWWRGSDI